MRARRQSASRGHWEVLGNYHRRKPSIMRRPALLIGLELLSGDSTMLYKLRQETTTIGEIMCSSNHDPETSSGGSQFPRIHLSVMVLEGSDSHILRVADGHVPGTALPGTIRKRRDRGPPRHLLSAAARDPFNDVITLTTLHGTFKYCVDGTEIVDPR